MQTPFSKADRLDEVNSLLEELQELDRKSYVTPTIFTWIYCSLGEINKGLDWAEKCIEEHDGLSGLFRDFPLYDPIRSHPRYKALLRKMNLESV